MQRWRVPLGFFCAALFILLARPQPRTLLIGGVIALCGLLIRAWAAGHIRKNDRLATSGPYAHTRNPLYLGSFILGLGFTIAAGRWWLLGCVFVALFLGIYLPVMRVEAQTLAELFGQDYELYARRVPLFLPRLTPYRAGAHAGVQFDASLYMRYREYRAALGLLIALGVLACKPWLLNEVMTILRRVFLLTLCTLMAALALPPAAAHADEHDRPTTTRPTPLPFEPTEELIYEGEFSKLLLRGVQIAEFRFTATRAAVNATPTNVRDDVPVTNLIFRGNADAKGWFRKLFGIDFHFNMESVVEPDTFTILRTTKADEQGKRVRASEAVFDRRAQQITWTERNPNDPASAPRVVQHALDHAAYDFLSAIYYLRTQPLVLGQRLELVMSDSGEVFHIPVGVVERKRMKTVLGRVQTLRVDIELFGPHRLIQDRTGHMSLWLTDDARRIPVRARLDMDLGALDIKLKRVGAPK